MSWKRRPRELRAENRGQAAQGMVSTFIGIMIAAIVALQVTMPVMFDAIATVQNNTTGSTQTILDLLPLFVALLLLIGIAAPLMARI